MIVTECILSKAWPIGLQYVPDVRCRFDARGRVECLERFIYSPSPDIE
jgi:hypothetical protein